MEPEVTRKEFEALAKENKGLKSRLEDLENELKRLVKYVEVEGTKHNKHLRDLHNIKG